MVRFVAALALLALAGGCVKHPGLPATGTSGYRAKASMTAEGVISGVETTRIGLDAEANGHATANYLAGLISDQEDGVGDVISSFESIAPPTAAARTLHADLAPILSDAEDHVRAVRIAFGADRRGEALALRKQLQADSRRLEKYVTP